jgi:hypothetical protein
MPAVQKINVNPGNPEARWSPNGPGGLFMERFSYKDFSAAATTVNKDITGFPGYILIEGAFVMFNVNFTGGSVGSATISVGTTGTPTAYVAAASVFSGAAATAPLVLPGTTIVPGTFLGGATPAAIATVRVQLVVTGANANTLTAGVCDVYLNLRAVNFRPK